MEEKCSDMCALTPLSSEWLNMNITAAHIADFVVLWANAQGNARDLR
jgi:hypothetical protein